MANRYFVCERIVGAISLITLEVESAALHTRGAAIELRDRLAAEHSQRNYVVQLNGQDVVGYSGAELDR